MQTDSPKFNTRGPKRTKSMLRKRHFLPDSGMLAPEEEEDEDPVMFITGILLQSCLLWCLVTVLVGKIYLN
jgi:hypothetical protein